MSQIALSYPPSLSGNTEHQLTQLKTYLFQLSEQLNVALNSLDEANFTESVKSQIISSGGSINEKTEEKIADTYNTLKATIIKTAAALNGDLSMLDLETTTKLQEIESNYVAQSQFGEYKAETSTAIEATSMGVTQMNRLIETINSAVDGLQSYRVGTESYIRTGLLYYEDVNGASVPRYGLAVGNDWTTVEVDGDTVYKEENFLSTFTANKISFWHQGNEIAYMSNNKLYITNVEIIQNLKQGSWLFDTVNYGYGGWALKWDGGN